MRPIASRSRRSSSRFTFIPSRPANVGSRGNSMFGAAPVTPNMEFPRDPTFAGLLGMKVNREELRRDREAIGRILAQRPDSVLAVDALATIGAVQKSTELSQALHELTVKQAEAAPPPNPPPH